MGRHRSIPDTNENAVEDATLREREESAPPYANVNPPSPVIFPADPTGRSVKKNHTNPAIPAEVLEVDLDPTPWKRSESYKGDDGHGNVILSPVEGEELILVKEVSDLVLPWLGNRTLAGWSIFEGKLVLVTSYDGQKKAFLYPG